MSTLVEYAVFGILMLCNLGLGLYFALFKRVANQTTDELFLGSRTLKVLPLAISSFASLASSTGIVGFIGHYYAYGFHFSWGAVAAILVLPVSVYVIIPALFKLKVTSIFEVSGIMHLASTLKEKKYVRLCIYNTIKYLYFFQNATEFSAELFQAAGRVLAPYNVLTA